MDTSSITTTSTPRAKDVKQSGKPQASLFIHLLWPGLVLAGFFIWRAVLGAIVYWDAIPYFEIAYIGAAAFVLLHIRRRAEQGKATKGVIAAYWAMWLGLGLCLTYVLPGSNYFGLLIVLVVPVAEELFFRELLLRSFAKLFGWPLAIILNVALFVFMHGGKDFGVMWQAALLGLACGLFLWKGGVIAAIICHTVWNFTVLLAETQTGMVGGGAFLFALIIWIVSYYIAGRYIQLRKERELAES